MTLNGVSSANESGASAKNSVYVDFSTDNQTAVLRESWDLAFYCGNEFRVFLNNTRSTGAKVLDKTDLAAVGTADTLGLTLAVSQVAPRNTHFTFFDNLSGAVNETLIPEIPATAASSKIIIVNRGNGGGIPSLPWIKAKITRNSSGYTIQYGTINATTFQTVNISKDNNYHRKLFSFDNGVIANGEPEKNNWDIVWSYSLFRTDFNNPETGKTELVPYNFSDLIAVNSLSNVQVKELIYGDATIATDAYSKFNKDSVAKYSLVADRWSIGSNWRLTVASGGEPAGVRKNRFYVVKDADGNYYKLQCLAMGAGTPPPDGGTRGKPQIKYELIK
ncbi:hypothetical protein GCM10027516_30420 [Niabella aquatica]